MAEDLFVVDMAFVFCDEHSLEPQNIHRERWKQTAAASQSFLNWPLKAGLGSCET